MVTEATRYNLRAPTFGKLSGEACPQTTLAQYAQPLLTIKVGNTPEILIATSCMVKAIVSNCSQGFSRDLV